MGKKTNYTNARVSTIIGADFVLDGHFTAKEPVRIDGEIKGNIKSESLLIIGPTGNVKGNIDASDVVIGGHVEGDILSNGRIEVASTGKIGGSITTRSLIIDENAVFTGQCTMYREEDGNKEAAKETV